MGYSAPLWTTAFLTFGVLSQYFIFDILPAKPKQDIAILAPNGL